MIKKTNKIFEEYFKQNLNEDMGAPDKDEVDAFFKPLKTSFKEFTHENKYIQEMVNKITSKKWIEQQGRFIIQTMVKDKDMLAIEETIDTGHIDLGWMPGNPVVGGAYSPPLERIGVMLPQLRNARGHFDLDTGEWVCPGDPGYNEKLAHIPIEIKGKKNIKENVINEHTNMVAVDPCRSGILGTIKMSTDKIPDTRRVVSFIEAMVSNFSNLENRATHFYSGDYADNPNEQLSAFEEIRFYMDKGGHNQIDAKSGQKMFDNMNIMMENYSFRQAIFEIATMHFLMPYVSTLMHELSHAFYMPTLDDTKLKIPRYFFKAIFLGREKGAIKPGSDGHLIFDPDAFNPIPKTKGIKGEEHWLGVIKDLLTRGLDATLGLIPDFPDTTTSWNAELTATSHTVKCLKDVRKVVQNLARKHINILSKDKDFIKNLPKTSIQRGRWDDEDAISLLRSLFGKIRIEVSEVDEIIQNLLVRQIKYAENGLEQAKVGGLDMLHDIGFDPSIYKIAAVEAKGTFDKEGRDRMVPEPPGAYLPDKFTNQPSATAADKLYSCIELLQTDESMKKSIHTRVIHQIRDAMPDRWPPIKTEKAFRKMIRNLKDKKQELKFSLGNFSDAEKMISIKGYPEYIDCLFEKQFGKLEEQTKVNKILQEYIMQNTPEPQKDVSIIEIIADEVNETLNNLPEVQLASEILSEDELKNLFSPFAKQVVTKVRGQIEEEIKKLVELTVNAAQLKDAVAQRMQMVPPKPVTDAEKEVLLSYFTQDELEAAGIEFEVTDVEGTGAAEEI